MADDDKDDPLLLNAVQIRGLYAALAPGAKSLGINSGPAALLDLASGEHSGTTGFPIFAIPCSSTCVRAGFVCPKSAPSQDRPVKELVLFKQN